MSESQSSDERVRAQETRPDATRGGPGRGRARGRLYTLTPRSGPRFTFYTSTALVALSSCQICCCAPYPRAEALSVPRLSRLSLRLTSSPSLSLPRSALGRVPCVHLPVCGRTGMRSAQRPADACARDACARDASLSLHSAPLPREALPREGGYASRPRRSPARSARYTTTSSGGLSSPGLGRAPRHGKGPSTASSSVIPRPRLPTSTGSISTFQSRSVSSARYSGSSMP